MNELIFQKLKSTVDGVGATTGKQTEKAFNENFDLVKDLFTEVLTALAITVTSSELKQIKVDTNTTPYTLYYSLDDESKENPTWIKLLQFGFSQLTGSPYDSISLKTVLDSKADQVSVDSINLQITGINNDIFSIRNNISDLTNVDSDLRDEITRLDGEDANTRASIQALKDNELRALSAKDDSLQNQISVLSESLGGTQSDLSRVVYTTEGNTLWIKYDMGANELQASTDLGVTWNPVGALSLQWKQLTGNPNDASSLVSYVNSSIETALYNYVKLEQLVTHTADISNPHKVTAAQLGLGSVLELINNIEQSESEIILANTVSYVKHASEISNKAYFLSSHFDRVPLTIEGDTYYEFIKTIAEGESFETVDGMMISKEAYENGTITIPVYYRVAYNMDEPTSLDIYYNETLYDYLQNGGVLD